MNFVVQTIKDATIGAAFEVAYFPFWWYSRGLKKAALYLGNKIRTGWKASGLWSFLKNFFKPMYGAYGIDTLVVSVIARILQMSWRFLLLAIWSFFLIFLLFVWVFLPPYLVWQVFF